MSDRKYRQSGYQDQGPRQRTPTARKPLEPYDPRIPRDPKTPNMPGFQDVFRCARCGHLENVAVGPDSLCTKCSVPLHTCINCSAFDAGARFECREPIQARVSPKDLRNECRFFGPRVSVERQTHSTPASNASSSGARKAFDDLFKF